MDSTNMEAHISFLETRNENLAQKIYFLESLAEKAGVRQRPAPEPGNDVAKRSEIETLERPPHATALKILGQRMDDLLERLNIVVEQLREFI